MERGIQKTQTTTLWFIVEEKAKMITKVSLRAGTGAGKMPSAFHMRVSHAV